MFLFLIFDKTSGQTGRLFVWGLMSYLCYLCLMCIVVSTYWLYIWVAYRVSNKRQVLLTPLEHLSSPLILNKTWALIQTTEDKDEPEIIFYAEIATDMEFRCMIVKTKKPKCRIYLVCVSLCIMVCNTYCVAFFFVLCTLCCQFLWVVHFWLHIRYSLTLTKINNFCLQLHYAYIWYMIYDNTLEVVVGWRKPSTWRKPPTIPVSPCHNYGYNICESLVDLLFLQKW
jgi:hypothetical protein